MLRISEKKVEYSQKIAERGFSVIYLGSLRKKKCVRKRERLEVCRVDENK